MICLPKCPFFDDLAFVVNDLSKSGIRISSYEQSFKYYFSIFWVYILIGITFVCSNGGKDWKASSIPSYKGWCNVIY